MISQLFWQCEKEYYKVVLILQANWFSGTNNNTNTNRNLRVIIKKKRLPWTTRQEITGNTALSEH